MESVDGERGISVVVSVVMISSISHWMLIHSFIHSLFFLDLIHDISLNEAFVIGFFI